MGVCFDEPLTPTLSPNGARGSEVLSLIAFTLIHRKG